MLEITLVLHNIRSTYNVGAILRTAEGLGVSQVVLSGYTPKYNDPKLLPHLREKLNRQIAKSALGAETLVPQIIVDDLPSWLEQQKGQTIIGLENNLSSDEQKKRLVLGRPHRQFDNIILILGEEVNGIPETVKNQCDIFLEIPMFGQKESFNVSVAAGIAIWGLQNT